MKTGRLEAFSDGVLAIIITIMVLEMKVPKEGTLEALEEVYPIFLSYILSFAYIGIYWNNHHHLLQATTYVNGRILWANLHLLFWLSLIPFVSGWVGRNAFTPLPAALYGVVLFMSAIAYLLLQRAILKTCKDSLLTKAIGKDIKGRISLVLYLAAIPLAFVSKGVTEGIFLAVAVMWFVPDKRIERTLYQQVRDNKTEN